MKLYNLIFCGFVVSLSSCGGGSSDAPVDPPIETPTTRTGVFVDGPVANIGYRTESILNGVTNALGEYEYLPGETVTFFIGALEFPAVPATGVVTPLDMAGTTDTSNPIVVNIIRLLQTLDQDGNPDTIEITDMAKSNATPVDFSLSVADFETSTAVVSLIPNAGQYSPPIQLVDADVAIQNFEGGLDDVFSINLTEITARSVISYSECPNVLGSWGYTFTGTTITLSGSDTWDIGCSLGATETISVPVADLASDSDLPFNCQSYPVCKIADLNKTISGTDHDGRTFTSTYSYDRTNKKLMYVKSVEGTTFTEVINLHIAGIAGAWSVGDSLVDTDTIGLLFTNDGTYVQFQPGGSGPGGFPGIEIGTYSWNTTTEVVTINSIATDTNGEWGFSNTIGGVIDFPFYVDGDSATFTTDEKEDVPLARITSTDFPIVGSWRITDAPVGVAIYLIFYTNGKVVHIEAGSTDPNGQDGMEVGTYTWNAATGALTVNVTIDTNGQWGFSSNTGDMTLLVHGDTATFTSVDGSGQLERTF